jgi:hypothetical protein
MPMMPLLKRAGQTALDPTGPVAACMTIGSEIISWKATNVRFNCLVEPQISLRRVYSHDGVLGIPASRHPGPSFLLGRSVARCEPANGSFATGGWFISPGRLWSSRNLQS